MRLHRGLALVLVVFGLGFAVLAPRFSTARGPAMNTAEALRRFQAAARIGDGGMAASLGAKALALAKGETDWAGAKLAGLEYRVALTKASLGRNTDALVLLRSANARLAGEPTSNTSLLVEIVEERGDLALATGRKMEAACTYGLALERFGPDRVSGSSGASNAEPALRAFAQHLAATGERFAAGEARPIDPGETWPPTSCSLLADYYAAQRDYHAANAVSRTVIAYARTDKTLGAQMRAGLLRRSGEIALGDGDTKAAGALFADAVAASKMSGDKIAYLSALERQARFMSSYGQPDKALPILKQVIAMREDLPHAHTSELIAPLISLGYAQLDTGEQSAAETTFKRAISLARTTSKQKPAELTATMGLAEVYEDQARTSEAQTMRARMATLQKAGVVPMPVAGIETASP